MAYCVSLKDAFREGKKEIGSKAYNLSLLMSFGFPVPRGFVIRAQCFTDFLSRCGIKEKIDGLLAQADADDPMKLSGASHEIRKLILSADVPDNIRGELVPAYTAISEREDIAGLNDIAKNIMGAGRSEASVSVRASFPNDEARNSFAGCAKAFLNVRGRLGFIEAVKIAWASYYSEHAIYYREKTGNQNIGMAVLVQLMMHPEKAGTIFTANPLTGDKNQEIIESVWGTGEAIALGAAVPDRYFLSKDSRMISDYSVGSKIWMYAEDDYRGGTRKEGTTERSQGTESISHAEIKAIEELARKIDERAGIPQDVEWAVSRGRIYILQARPVIFGRETNGSTIPSGEVAATGVPASRGFAEGHAKMLYEPAGFIGIESGDVVVSKDASPMILPFAKKASAIITEEGGMLSPAATLMREFGVPMVVGAKGIVDVQGKFARITVDATRGKIYGSGAAGAPLAIDAGLDDVSLDSNATTLLATKIRVIEPNISGEAAAASPDGTLVLSDIFSSAQADSIAADIAKAAERVRPSNLWIKIPKPDSAELAGAGAAINGAISRGYKNISAIIPSVYSRSHVEQARNVLVSSGLDLSSLELGILVDSPAGAVMACEFAQAGVSLACIDSDALIKNMFGLDNGASPDGLDMHPAFLHTLERCIKSCRKQKMHTVFFGRAASDPRVIERLVEFGIDSICVLPEQASMARLMAARAEKKMLIEILKNRDRFYRKEGQ